MVSKAQIMNGLCISRDITLYIVAVFRDTRLLMDTDFCKIDQSVFSLCGQSMSWGWAGNSQTCATSMTHALTSHFFHLYHQAALPRLQENIAETSQLLHPTCSRSDQPVRASGVARRMQSLAGVQPTNNCVCWITQPWNRYHSKESNLHMHVSLILKCRVLKRY